VIDVFVDRCFRHNFDPSNADDAFLVRRIAFLNEVLLDTGLVRPISPRRPAILAELAMVIRNVDSLHDHRALFRYLMGIVFLIGNSLEDTSMWPSPQTSPAPDAAYTPLASSSGT
jgi:hypothetical protein